MLTFKPGPEAGTYQSPDGHRIVLSHPEAFSTRVFVSAPRASFRELYVTECDWHGLTDQQDIECIDPAIGPGTTAGEVTVSFRVVRYRNTVTYLGEPYYKVDTADTFEYYPIPSARVIVCLYRLDDSRLFYLSALEFRGYRIDDYRAYIDYCGSNMQSTTVIEAEFNELIPGSIATTAGTLWLEFNDTPARWVPADGQPPIEALKAHPMLYVITETENSLTINITATLPSTNRPSAN